jgi:hypothetical protein
VSASFLHSTLFFRSPALIRINPGFTLERIDQRIPRRRGTGYVEP